MTIEDLIVEFLSYVGVQRTSSSFQNNVHPLTADEATSMLNTLNLMLDGWYGKGIQTNALIEENFSLTASQPSFTIGPNGVFNTSLPIKIKNAWLQDQNNIIYPLNVLLTRDEYFAQTDSQIAGGIPTALYFDGLSPIGTIYLYPMLNAVENSTFTLHLISEKNFAEFTSIALSFTLAPSWEEAIAYNAALRAAQKFNQTASPEVVKIARDSLQIVAAQCVDRQPMKYGFRKKTFYNFFSGQAS